MFRIANYVMVVLFLSWAYFQFNDPDPLLWLLLYGLAAAACVLYAVGKLPSSAALAFSIAGFLGAVYLALLVMVEREPIFDETGREMMGLLIVAGWVGWLGIRARKGQGKAKAAA